MSSKMCGQQIQFSFNVSIDLDQGFFQFDTPEIVVAEVPWKIRLRKIATTGNRDSVDFRLICNYKETHPKWSIDAAAILRLVTYSGTKKQAYLLG